MNVSDIAIVFVLGSWHLPIFFDEVRNRLTTLGYNSVAVPHPSMGALAGVKDLTDDIATLRATIEECSSEGKRVVLVVHSYGGLVASGAAEGMGLKERKVEDKKGGIIMILYFAAFIIPKGSTMLDALGGKLLPWCRLEVRIRN
jgi:hypothetical protein